MTKRELSRDRSYARGEKKMKKKQQNRGVDDNDSETQ
jgi:hypothetical protein